MANTVKATFVFDDSGAKKGVKSISGEFDKLGAAATVSGKSVQALIDDTQKLDKTNATVVLAIKGGQIKKELSDILVEVATLDSKDATIGLRIDKANVLKADLDTIEAKIKQLDGSSTKASVGIDRIGRSANSSKSVLANMIGNATQDMGAFAGIAGSAGVAIGQMGEYMADASGEGEKFSSVMGSFAKVAGPIAAIAAVTGTLTSVMRVNAEIAKNNADQVANWVKALDSGSAAQSKYFDQLKETGKVMSDTSQRFDKQNSQLDQAEAGWTGLGGVVNGVKTILGQGESAVKDISGTMDEAGLSVSQFIQATTTGTTGMAQWTEAINSSNLSMKDKDILLSAMVQSQGNYSAAVEKSAKNERIFAEAVTDSGVQSLINNSNVEQLYLTMLDQAGAAEKVAAAEKKITDNDAFARAYDDRLRAVDKLRRGIDDEASAALRANSAHLAAVDADSRVKEAVDKYNAVLKGTPPNLRDVTVAQEELTKAKERYDKTLKVTSSTDLDKQKALLRLDEAKAKLSSVIIGSTDEEKQQAAIDLANAQQKYNASLSDGSVSYLERQKLQLEVTKAEKKYRETQHQSTETDLDRRQALIDLDEAQAAYDVTVNGTTGTAEEQAAALAEVAAKQQALDDANRTTVASEGAKKQAFLDVQQAINDAAGAHAAEKQTLMDEAGLSYGVRDALDAQITTLEAVEKTLRPGSALYQANAAHIQQLRDARDAAAQATAALGNFLNGFGGSTGIGGVGVTPEGNYAKGGTVPGPIGRPQMAVVHGGETVIPAGGARSGPGGNGSVVNYITFNVPPVGDQGQWIVDKISKFERANGASWRNN